MKCLHAVLAAVNTQHHQFTGQHVRTGVGEAGQVPNCCECRIDICVCRRGWASCRSRGVGGSSWFVCFLFVLGGDRLSTYCNSLRPVSFRSFKIVRPARCTASRSSTASPAEAFEIIRKQLAGAALSTPSSKRSFNWCASGISVSPELRAPLFWSCHVRLKFSFLQLFSAIHGFVTFRRSRFPASFVLCRCYWIGLKRFFSSPVT